MDIYYMIVFFMFGAVLGSFYNVVGYRIPKGESLIYPSSHCTNCGHKLRFYELVPILKHIAESGNDARIGLNKYRKEIVEKVTSNISKQKI